MAPSILPTSSTTTTTSNLSVAALRPVTAVEDIKNATLASLVLQDGTTFQGVSFGAEGKSISGECVFQTGMHAIYHFHVPFCVTMSFQVWLVIPSPSPIHLTVAKFLC